VCNLRSATACAADAYSCVSSESHLDQDPGFIKKSARALLQGPIERGISLCLACP
jgi:hypothetical protein